ncbi:Hypothetical predicted protein [Scomber scombrus]|uniref:Uncharacterized protein n=1 Tax=Scomber scombrus TaxID=13677 RepID=A0AAV1PHW2_SCOSC
MSSDSHGCVLSNEVQRLASIFQMSAAGVSLWDGSVVMLSIGALLQSLSDQQCCTDTLRPLHHSSCMMMMMKKSCRVDHSRDVFDMNMLFKVVQMQ